MKGRPIWTYPTKLNNNMDTEKVEVKYVGGTGLLSPTTGLPLTSTKFSLLLSILSLVIAVSFFCLVLAWLWGVPEKIAVQNEEVERLEQLLVEQQDTLDEIISSRNKPAQRKQQNNVLSQIPDPSSSSSSPCLLLPSPGPCTTSSLQRWHYHAPSGRCRQFTYGGCHGNNNNFVTARQCEQTCEGVRQPSMDHVGPSFRGIVTAKNQVPQVPTKDQWRKGCLLPPTSGPCRGQQTRYYWDENISSCSTFFYGGCAGNTNNFITHKECIISCRKETDIATKSEDVHDSIPRLAAPQPDSPVSQCMQDSDPGACKSNFLRWYFDSKTSTCRKFTWGGCGGNSNNFLTEAKCEARCNNSNEEEEEDNTNKGEEEDNVIKEEEEEDNDMEVHNDVEVMEEESRDEMCSKPAKKGNCRGNLPRFFYNLETEKCEEFSYGGCGGNKNNFLTEEVCKETCVHV